MPVLPKIIAGPAQLGRRAVASDLGGGAGLAALGQASKELGEIELRLFNEEMESNVSGSVGRVDRELNTLALEVGKEPDHHKRTKMYADASRKIVNDAREGLRYPKFQGRFSERIAGSLERGRMGIAQGVRQSQIDSASAGRLLNIEALQESFAKSADPEHRRQIATDIFTEIDEGTRGGLWPADVAARMEIAAKDRMESEDLLAEAYVRLDKIAADHAGDPDAMIDEVRKAPIAVRPKLMILMKDFIATNAMLEKKKLSAKNYMIITAIDSGKYDGLNGAAELIKEGERLKLPFRDTIAFTNRLNDRKTENTTALKRRSDQTRVALELLHSRFPEMFFDKMDLHYGGWKLDPGTGVLMKAFDDDPEGTTLGNMMTSADRKFIGELQDAGPASAQSADQDEADAAINNMLRGFGFGTPTTFEPKLIPLTDQRAYEIRKTATRAIDSARKSAGGYLLPAELDKIILTVKDHFSKQYGHGEQGVFEKIRSSLHPSTARIALDAITPESWARGPEAPLSLITIDDIFYEDIPNRFRNIIEKKLHVTTGDERSRDRVRAEYLMMLRAGAVPASETY